MKGKQLVIVVSSSLICACAGTGPPADDGNLDASTYVSDCISAASIRDYRVLDDATLLVSAFHERHYQVTLKRSSRGLRFANRISFAARGGRICSDRGEVVVREGPGVSESIRIDTVYRIGQEQLSTVAGRTPAGESRPLPEHGSPPDVEGAELEELD